MATRLAIITGGGTGIGAALARRLAEHCHVLIVGRRPGPLKETRGLNPEKIRTVVADVSTPEGRAAVVGSVRHDETVPFLVHNAGSLGPVAPLAEVDPVSWRSTMAVNFDAPLFLTQAVLPKMPSGGGGRILHVGSGAARSAYRGWGAYCASKAGLHMMYRVLDLELAPRGVRVGSVRPGVVDTPMQDLVRDQDAGVFPDLPRFLDLKESGSLKDPVEVAQFLDWILRGVGADEFAAEEWDIYEERHQSRWSNFT